MLRLSMNISTYIFIYQIHIKYINTYIFIYYHYYYIDLIELKFDDWGIRRISNSIQTPANAKVSFLAEMPMLRKGFR